MKKQVREDSHLQEHKHYINNLCVNIEERRSASFFGVSNFTLQCVQLRIVIENYDEIGIQY
jgi:hypothetical protein